MPHYKLMYFNLRGYGEGPRLLLHYAGVPFEDVRVTFEEWPKLKAKMPFRQLPVLEVDGRQIAQSAAICRYLGRQFSKYLVPKCPIEEAMVDAVHDAHKDFQYEIRDYLLISEGFAQGDKDEKVKMLKDVVLPAANKYFGYLRGLLIKSDGTHLVGKTLTWADIVIADNLHSITIIIPTLFDGQPEIKKYVDGILQIPAIKKYIEERPETPF
uniref:glutathione transferase n=1 Tax=Syphacia muris TaxID=451379 RepID=A0A0N5AQ31_9BILA